MSVSTRFCLFLLASMIAQVAASPYREKRDTVPTGPVTTLTGGTAELFTQLFAAYITILNQIPLFGPLAGGILGAANPGNVIKTVGGSVDTLTNPLTGALGNLPGIIPGAVKGVPTGAPSAPEVATTTPHA